MLIDYRAGISQNLELLKAKINAEWRNQFPNNCSQCRHIRIKAN